MSIIQAVGEWDSGEVVAVGMVSGRRQIEDMKRIAGLQETTLSHEEKREIERRRAQAAERKDLLRTQAERSRQEATELQSKLARRRALEQADDAKKEAEDTLLQQLSASNTRTPGITSVEPGTDTATMPVDPESCSGVRNSEEAKASGTKESEAVADVSITLGEEPFAQSLQTGQAPPENPCCNVQ